jgi:transposase
MLDILSNYQKTKFNIMSKHVYLGIDVSKGYADFLLVDQERSVLEEAFQLEDTVSGRSMLGGLIKGWLAGGIDELRCGVESTGGYENNWYDYLHGLSRTLNIKVARLNPKGVKAMGDAAMKRTVTDAVSAENIAAYMIGFPEKLYCTVGWQGEQEFKEARQHLAFIKMLTKQKVQLSNQLEKLLYQYFGEMMVYCRHGAPTWLLKLLTKHPGAQSVVKAGTTRLAKIKGVSTEKAESLIVKSKRSEQTVNAGIQRTISMTAEQILKLSELIKGERDHLTGRFKDNGDVALVQSIVGIGQDSAVSIVMEIEDIGRFASSKKLCSYFGVHPIFKQSGDGTWNIRMSKKGRGDIRGILYMCALSAIKADNGMKKLYARFRAQGMKHYAAMGVVMHKLLRVIYGVLANKTTYNPLVDLQNQENAESKRKLTIERGKQKTEKRSRYMVMTSNAPVSKFKSKKMKQGASQASQAEECTGLQPAS